MEDIIQEQVMVACKDQAQFMKGKRTKSHRPPSPLRLTIAMPPSATATTHDVSSGGFHVVTNTSSSELRDRSSTPSTTTPTEEEEDMANCLIVLARSKFSHPKDGAYLYQCKTCDRSFRALGGHRARHKKMKPNPENNGYDDCCTSTALSLQISNCRVSLYGAKSSSKVHDCSICGAEFSSGQALGGHMRRHRASVKASASTTITSSPESQEVKKPRNVFKLDLNLPAPHEDHDHSESKFPFHTKDSFLVFSASTLLDCHY